MVHPPSQARRILPLVVSTLLGAGLLTGCGDSKEEEEARRNQITVWTPHLTPSEMKVQQDVAAKFTAKTGIRVNVVGIGGADQNQSLVTGAASGNVPDVILGTPDAASAWAGQGLIDPEATDAVVNKLGRQTFATSALAVFTIGGKVAGVPTDGWSHLLVYRKDLFAEAGLSTGPRTIAEAATAAEKIKGAPLSGMAMGTQPGTPSATESLESVLKAAGCELFTNGKPNLSSEACVAALGLYKRLADSSVAGAFDVNSARSAYLAGRAGMLLSSSHILDELAGLDKANPPTCAQCQTDPAFLAKNSGFVTVLQTPTGKGVTFGLPFSYMIPKNAKTPGAQAYIEFVTGEGYIDTLSTAPEGRIPLRTGTPDQPNSFVTGWAGLPIGAEQKTLSLTQVYGASSTSQFQQGAASIARWGFGTPQAAVAAAVSTQNVLAKRLDPLYQGTPPREVAAMMKADVQAIQKDLGG